MSHQTPRQLAYTGAPTAALAAIGVALASAGVILRRAATWGANRRMTKG